MNFFLVSFKLLDIRSSVKLKLREAGKRKEWICRPPKSALCSSSFSEKSEIQRARSSEIWVRDDRPSSLQGSPLPPTPFAHSPFLYPIQLSFVVHLFFVKSPGHLKIATLLQCSASCIFHAQKLPLQVLFCEIKRDSCNYP